jgi:hypothetical protein
MSKSSDISRFPFHRIGVGGLVRVRVFGGSGVSGVGLTGARSPRHAFVTLAVAVTMLGGFVCMCASVQAATIHVFSGSFTGTGANALSEPEGVAVNDETGDVYVLDSGHKRVEEFNATGGAFLAEFDGSAAPDGPLEAPAWIAVDNSSNPLDPSKGDVYVTGEVQVAGKPRTVVYKFSAAGIFLEEISTTFGGIPFLILHGIAVDPEGNLWVYEKPPPGHTVNYGYGEVNEFSNNGTAVSSYATYQAARNGFAVDAGDNAFVACCQRYGKNVNENGAVVLKFSAAGVKLHQYGEGGEFVANPPPAVTALALQPSANNLFVDHGSNIENYGGPSSELLLETFAAGLSGSEGLAVNDEGTVYATQRSAGSVAIFDEVIVATVAAEPVSNLKPTGVTLNGTVNPEGIPVTGCEFEYGTEAGVYPQKQPCSQTLPLTGAAPVPVSATVSGLTPDTTYHYRLATIDPNPSATADQVFTTRGAQLAAAPVSNLQPTTVTLNATINPEETSVSACEFEYGAEAGVYPDKLPCSQTLPLTGTAPLKVSANVSGLSSDTTYHYRLVAADPNKRETADQTLTTPGPGIGEEQAVNVEATGATVQAQIDPNRLPTTYQFEYDTSPYTSSETHGISVPASPVSLGSGTSTLPASVRLTGLHPGATYYYRVVVVVEIEDRLEALYGPDKELVTPTPENGTSTASCANERVRGEQHAQALPDCRAYELVSPVEKNDYGVSYFNSRASVSGEALTYESRGAFSEPKSALLESRYLARRTPGGWSTENLVPFYSPIITNLRVPFDQLLFTPALSKGILTSYYTPLVAGEPAGYVNVYDADIESGSYQTVSNVTPPKVEPYSEGLEGAPTPLPEGASTDLSHVVFQQSYNLCCGASPEHEHVYEWAGGKLSLVDVAPGGGSFVEASADVGAPAAKGEPLTSGNTWHAVSADGSRVYFTESYGQADVVGQLYVRENPLAPSEGCSVPGDACTVEVSASQRDNGRGEPDPDPHGPQPAFYRDASADGSRVFFTSRAELTTNAFTGPDDNAGNLYEYNLNTGVLSDLTVDTTDTDGAAVLGLATAGEDGSYVYFVANGVLSEAPNAEGAKAVVGDCKKQETEVLAGEPKRTCNLYVEHYNGNAWETPTFVATLAGGNSSQAFLFGRNHDGDEEDWLGEESSGNDFGPGRHSANVTPDGSTLVFTSERSLTGYDNAPAKAGECPGGERCNEVYMYSAPSGSLRCVSCNPTGARPTGGAATGRGAQAEQGKEEGFVVAESSPFYVERDFSEDGKRVFFDSTDALVPAASNGLRNVYEWEAVGEGSCESASISYSASDGGCVFPISDVAGGYESRFMDASANGDDVFIATPDRLVAETSMDNRRNVYDVRIGGGFPAPGVAPSCSNADSCKPPVSPQPSVFGTPASATFSGPGNLPPVSPAPPKATKKRIVKCKKRFVKNRRGRCVRQKARKAAKKSSARAERRVRS